MLKFFENKLALICATVVVISILAAVVLVFRASNQRYYLAPGKNGIAYKIDRKTGKTWFVRGTSLREIDESQPERQLSALPESTVASLTGTAGYSVRSLFSGRVYNSSDWHIRELRIRIWNEPNEENEEWSRTFIDQVFISPEATGSFQVDTVDGNRAEANNWTIVSAKGYRE